VNQLSGKHLPEEKARAITGRHSFERMSGRKAGVEKRASFLRKGIVGDCKGDHRIYCAGAIARAYEEMGGVSLYFGKPHPPIYDLARQRLDAIADVGDSEIICIGDGINTDIRGAMAEDLDSLFITGGLAAEETRTAPDETAQPDAARLKEFLDNAQLSPQYAMGHLR